METNEMNKDTPETDAKTHDVGDSTECLMVSAEVTRKLERERDEWKTEAKRWRDMYLQFDEMLESDIKDATKKVSDIIAQIKKLSKKINKGY